MDLRSTGITKIAIYYVIQSYLQWITIFDMTSLEGRA